MATLALTVVLLAFVGSSSASWCVCKDGSDTILQKTIEYFCGVGGGDCPPHQNGLCFQPNTLRAQCNYAVNSYFQRMGQAPGSCDFGGTAIVTASNPSTPGCSYPSASTAGTSTTPMTTTLGSTGAISSPYSTTPGVLGGIGSGMGPSEVGTNTDGSDGGFRLLESSLLSPFSIPFFSGLVMMLWWG